MQSSFPMAESRPGTHTGATTRFPTGSLGVFWFLGSEFAVFTGLAIAFMAGRRPEWTVQRQDLEIGVAALGTLGLLASCCTLARAYALQRASTRAVVHDPPAADTSSHGVGAAPVRPWLVATLVMGIGFLACVGVEWVGALGRGHGLGASGYWAHWFLLTGMHASRVLAGVVTLAIVAARRGAARYVGAFGLYWLFVCVVWFVYFPMLYVSG